MQCHSPVHNVSFDNFRAKIGPPKISFRRNGGQLKFDYFSVKKYSGFIIDAICSLKIYFIFSKLVAQYKRDPSLGHKIYGKFFFALFAALLGKNNTIMVTSKDIFRSFSLSGQLQNRTCWNLVHIKTLDYDASLWNQSRHILH